MCHNYWKTGHTKNDCTKKGAKDQKTKAVAAIGGGSKDFLYCGKSGAHTFNDSFTFRLWACDKFKGLSSAEQKAKVIQDLKGCFLCLDPRHNTEICRLTYTCKVNNGVNVYRKRHSHVLHGAKGYQQCNMVVSSTRSAEPTILLGMMMCTICGRSGITQGLVFWDNGATLAIVRERFAEVLGLTGRQV